MLQHHYVWTASILRLAVLYMLVGQVNHLTGDLSSGFL
jgi:hypothetical protein